MKPPSLPCLFLVSLCSALCLLLPSSAGANPDTGRIGHQELTIPAGVALPVLLLESISTETGVPGQSVTAMIAQDLFIGQQKVLSRKDHLLGQITAIQPPSQGRNAILQVDFNLLALENGLHLPVSTMVDTERNLPYWGGEVTEGTKPVVVPYHVYQIGSYGRVMYHGPRAMGEHVRLFPGSRIILILKQPLTLYTN